MTDNRLPPEERERLAREKEEKRLIKARIASGEAQESCDRDIAGNVGARNENLDRFLDG